MVQRVCRSVVIFVGIALLIGLGVQAQEKKPATKAPWEWTIEERLAERYDPVKVEERRLLAVEKALHQDPRLENRTIHDPHRAFIDGSETPELFMPFELFSGMIDKAFLADPEYCAVYQEEVQALAGDFGKRDDLWPMIEMITAEVIAIKQDMRTLGRDPAYHDINDERYVELRERRKALGLESCRARFVALQVAREHFGEVAFNRFLYEAIASTEHASYSWDGENREMVETARYAAGGCQ